MSDKTTQNVSPSEVRSLKFKWIVVFLFLTLLSILSVRGLCVDSYVMLTSRYRAWYRFWTDTVNTQLILDLQNYKINREDKLLNSDEDFRLTGNSTLLNDPGETREKSLEIDEDHQNRVTDSTISVEHNGKHTCDKLFTIGQEHIDLEDNTGLKEINTLEPQGRDNNGKS